METQEKLLFAQVREQFRQKHYSCRTEDVYLGWIKRFLKFHDNKQPDMMGGSEIRAFLKHLARNLSASTSTQNQAFCALSFLYREVLGREPGLSIESVRAKKPVRESESMI